MCDYDEHERERSESQIQERAKILGFKPQKELPWNKYLPYADQVDKESETMLNWIKENLAKAVAMRDLEVGVQLYTSRLLSYFKLYGLKFSKEDHIKLIKLYLELISLPELPPVGLNRFCVLLLQLFQKPCWLHPNDLQIEWRPLYKLFIIFLQKSSSKGSAYQFFSKRNKKDESKNMNLSLFDEIISLALRFDETLKLNKTDSDDNTE